MSAVLSWSPSFFFFNCGNIYIMLLFSHLVISDSLVIPWTAGHQAPLSMGFTWHECYSGLPFPSPGDLPDPEIKSTSPTVAGGFFTTGPPGKPIHT